MLPDGWTERPATRPDLTDVARLVIATDVAEFGAPDWSESDQADEWADPRLDLAADTLVVHDDGGRLAGYAYVVARVAGVDFDSDTLVDPECRVAGVEEHLMAFTERRAREQIDPAAAEPRLMAFVHAPNTARGQRVRVAGFVPVRQFYRMTLVLDGSRVASPVPTGVVVRDCTGVEDVRLVHALLTEAFREHYRSVPQSFEDWSARHPHADDDPAPWLLAEVDGVAVGALTSSVSVPGLGWIFSVGVLRQSRGRGIGLALLHRAFDDLRALGRASVSLGVDAENSSGALRLYEKAGMHVERRFDFYAKALG
ncbi:MAG TPA: GNAT family N-acetyltransferase [Mycobacteriales bacterium]|nr:GNAT family N-acetyltransferase [Mycobacteriales bacterium]